MANDEEVTNQEAKQEQPVQPTKGKSAPQGGSKVFLIVLIVIAAIAVLGLAGYFAYRFVKGQPLGQDTGTKEAQEEAVDKTTSVKALIEMLLYPGSEIIDQKQEMDGVYVAEVNLSSQDPVDQIKNYYLKLIQDKKWQVTRQGSDPNYENYFITFTDGVFTDDLDITKYDGDDYVTIQHILNGEALVSDGLYVPQASSVNSPSASVPTTAATGDYVIAYSSERIINGDELINLTPWQLKVARNEIYARHGRPFVHKDMQCYFAKKSWYKVDANYDASSLSYIENTNVAMIQAYEQATNSPLASSDSGCNTYQ